MAHDSLNMLGSAATLTRVEQAPAPAQTAPAPVTAAGGASLLSSRAMLASLSITQWTARKLDKRVTEKANADHGAAADAGRFNKCLIAQSALAGLVTVANAARSSHRKFTQPWLANGQDILSSGLHAPYVDAMRKHREDFYRELDSFIPAYPALVDDARNHLGAMFNPADYPSPDAIRAKFSFRTALFPVPDASDWRVDVGADNVAAIRAEIESACNAALAGAMRDAWERVAAKVGHMVESLRDYKPGQDGQKATGIFRDSMVENVRDLVAILPGLNITQDPALAAITARMEKGLCRYSASDLREGADVRDRVRAEAEAILKDVSEFMA